MSTENPMTTLPERLLIAAEILEGIGGQSALAATVREAATALQPSAGGEVGEYEWFDAKAGVWKPVNRLPYTWEVELGVQWRASTLAASPAQPSGFVLVPDEPTAEMVRAGRNVDDLADMSNVRRIYRAMVVAAQPAPAVDGDARLSDEAIEAVARALCKSRSVGPEVLHIDATGEMPVDGTVVALVDGKLAERPAFFGWRKQVAHARAALEAVISAAAPSAPIGQGEGCRARLAQGQHWAFCGETDMGQSLTALCTDCGGEYIKEPK